MQTDRSATWLNQRHRELHFFTFDNDYKYQAFAFGTFERVVVLVGREVLMRAIACRLWATAPWLLLLVLQEDDLEATGTCSRPRFGDAIRLMNERLDTIHAAFEAAQQAYHPLYQPRSQAVYQRRLSDSSLHGTE